MTLPIRLDFRFELDRAGIDRMLTNPRGPVGRDLDLRGRRVQDRARTLANKDTGRMAGAIKREVVQIGGRLVCRVYVDLNIAPYAKYVVSGTGLYGPRGRRIYPVRARYLRWVDRGGQVHYARSVRGYVGNPFMSKALAAGGGRIRQGSRL